MLRSAQNTVTSCEWIPVTVLRTVNPVCGLTGVAPRRHFAEIRLKDATDKKAGDSVNVQGTPACVTVNVWPAIVSVPVRDVALVFAATEYVTAPFPAPVLPPVIVSHDALLDALHAHVPADAVTLTLPLDAPEAGDRLVGDSVNVHATPACVTVNVCPAVSVEGGCVVHAAVGCTAAAMTLTSSIRKVVAFVWSVAALN